MGTLVVESGSDIHVGSEIYLHVCVALFRPAGTSSEPDKNSLKNGYGIT